MKIELEVKIDGERFFYDSAETLLTREPDGKWKASGLHDAEIDYCRLMLMTTKTEVAFHNQFVFPWLLSSSASAKGDAQ